MEKQSKLIKKIIKITVLVIFLFIFAATLIFLIIKSQKTSVAYDKETPEKRTIIHKTVATGSIVPEKEIEVKSRISGIVDKTYVEIGDTIIQGDLLVSVKIIPDSVTLNRAESNLKKAEICYTSSKKELNRQTMLYEKKIIAEIEYNKYLLDYELARANYISAENNLSLIKEGASKKSGQVSNRIYAPAAGMILDMPVKTGSTIVESNNFNDGTTIAYIADMNNLIFEGYLDESEIGKIKIGMEINILVAAIEGESFNADLEYISPKGLNIEGSIQFKIKAPVELKEDYFLRAGYSANAEIIFAKAEKVLTIHERNIIFDKNHTFVEIENGSNTFEKEEVTIGLSDGIYVEIKSGLNRNTEIKVQPSNTMQQF